MEDDKESQGSLDISKLLICGVFCSVLAFAISFLIFGTSYFGFRSSSGGALSRAIVAHFMNQLIMGFTCAGFFAGLVGAYFKTKIIIIILSILVGAIFYPWFFIWIFIGPALGLLALWLSNRLPSCLFSKILGFLNKSLQKFRNKSAEAPLKYRIALAVISVALLALSAYIVLPIVLELLAYSKRNSEFGYLFMDLLVDMRRLTLSYVLLYGLILGASVSFSRLIFKSVLYSTSVLIILILVSFDFRASALTYSPQQLLIGANAVLVGMGVLILNYLIKEPMKS